MDNGQDVDFNELNMEEILTLYRQVSEDHGIDPHTAFIDYLEKHYDDNMSLDITLCGNHKYMFTERITDQHLIVICETLKQYAIYIEDVDLSYNEITDVGAQALANLIRRSPRLVGLNLMGNKIKHKGAEFVADALKYCTSL